MTSNKLVDTLFVLGKEYDRIEDAAGGQPTIAPGLLQDIFPNTTFSLFSTFEQAYALRSDGTDDARRKRILAAIKKQGGLTKLYIERIANTLGGSVGPFRYLLEVDTTPPPANQSIKISVLLDEIYVDNDTLDDEDIQTILLERQPTDRLFLFNGVDGDNFQSFDITSVSNEGGHTKFIVTLSGSNGAPFSNNQDICLVIGSINDYQVKITEGSGGTGFIIHTFGSSTIPTGPATPLPGILLDISSIGGVFEFDVHVYNNPLVPDLTLERLINEIKGAWTKETFIYH